MDTIKSKSTEELRSDRSAPSCSLLDGFRYDLSIEPSSNDGLTLKVAASIPLNPDTLKFLKGVLNAEGLNVVNPLFSSDQTKIDQTYFAHRDTCQSEE